MQNQRWAEGRSYWRPAHERIDPRLYDVAAIDDDTTARDFIEQHHYSRSFPPARYRVGLYRSGALEGVAVFGQGMPMTLPKVFPDLEPDARVELGRFVLLDEVPGNGETWFLARAFRILRAQGVRGIVSFSDPVPRRNAAGELIFPGHIGTIYQAHNAKYLGRADGRTLHILPDGRALNNRAIGKIRRGERGGTETLAELERWGADPLDPAADYQTRDAWLDRWLGELTRPLKHTGNHRYAWSFARPLEGGAYPKLLAA